MNKSQFLMTHTFSSCFLWWRMKSGLLSFRIFQVMQLIGSHPNKGPIRVFDKNSIWRRFRRIWRSIVLLFFLGTGQCICISLWRRCLTTLSGPNGRITMIFRLWIGFDRRRTIRRTTEIKKKCTDISLQYDFCSHTGWSNKFWMETFFKQFSKSRNYNQN